jgi:hypothetical protein
MKHILIVSKIKIKSNKKLLSFDLVFSKTIEGLPPLSSPLKNTSIDTKMIVFNG